MKWLSDRLTYLLVILAVVVTLALQLAWLEQLYQTQSEEVRKDLEITVANAAKISTYNNTVTGHKSSQTFRNFMMSNQWSQLRQAYDDIRFHHIRSSFNFIQEEDTTRISVSLRFANVEKNNTRHGYKIAGMKSAENIGTIKKKDSMDLRKMDSILDSQLQLMKLKTTYIPVIYNYDLDKLDNPRLQSLVQNAAFKSNKYTYNFYYLKSYQIIVPTLFPTLLFRMRFYLISSCFTIFLTCAVFYFLLRLMRDQHLYVQARVAFTSNMTHELKTPVATVSVALQSIKKFKLFNEPEKLEKYIDICEKELNRLTLMIENVLNLEQIDNDKLKLRPELYDVQQGLLQVVTTMLIQVENKNSKIIYKPSSDPCFINGDPIHLPNAFYNLIDNALKFGGEAVTVLITCVCDSNRVIISIQDNGPGIANMYHNKIFDRFFRIQENENIQSTKGSGLGLNYVKSIIVQSAGSIELQSQLGKGSKFVITLPVYHEE